MKLDQYLGTVPPHRKHIFRELLCFINMMYPDAKPSMKYKMPTFTNGNGWVALANQKTLYLALHLQPSEHLADFKKKHPKVKTGKGCVNIQDKDDYSVTELASLIRSAMEKRYD